MMCEAYPWLSAEETPKSARTSTGPLDVVPLQWRAVTALHVQQVWILGNVPDVGTYP